MAATKACLQSTRVPATPARTCSARRAAVRQLPGSCLRHDVYGVGACAGSTSHHSVSTAACTRLGCTQTPAHVVTRPTFGHRKRQRLGRAAGGRVGVRRRQLLPLVQLAAASLAWRRRLALLGTNGGSHCQPGRQLLCCRLGLRCVMLLLAALLRRCASRHSRRSRRGRRLIAGLCHRSCGPLLFPLLLRRLLLLRLLLLLLRLLLLLLLFLRRWRCGDGPACFRLGACRCRCTGQAGTQSSRCGNGSRHLSTSGPGERRLGLLSLPLHPTSPARHRRLLQ